MPVLLGEVSCKGFGFLIHSLVLYKCSTSGTEHLGREEPASQCPVSALKDAIFWKCLSPFSSGVAPIPITCPRTSRPAQGVWNSAAAEEKSESWLLRQSLWETDIGADSKIRCSLSETNREAQRMEQEVEMLLWELGAVRQWQLSELTWKGWQKQSLLKWCQKKMTMPFQHSVRVTNKMSLASFPKTSSSFKWNYFKFITPLRLNISRHCFIRVFYPFCAVMTTVFFPIISVKSQLQAGLTQQWFTLDEEMAGATHSLCAVISAHFHFWFMFLLHSLIRIMSIIGWYLADFSPDLRQIVWQRYRCSGLYLVGI